MRNGNELTIFHIATKISRFSITPAQIGSVDKLSNKLKTIATNIESWSYDFEKDALTIIFKDSIQGDFSLIGDENP